MYKISTILSLLAVRQMCDVNNTLKKLKTISNMSILSQVIDNERMKNIRKEFSRLGDKCYLDNAGAALYPQCLLKRINEDLLNNVYMNPHSDNYTKDCIEQIRYLVLNHFNTDSSNYSLIFTSGATQALKLVVEAFQFHDDIDDQSSSGSYMYLRDNHTSVLGLREIAKEREVDIVHITRDDFLDSLKIEHQLKNGFKKQQKGGNTLFVYPAQSNFNGYKYPINCINHIKNGCLNNYLKKHLCNVDCNWYILLDVASYIATSKLDLSVTKPDFLCLSFYKIFGYPTGLGALLVKNSSAHILSQKKYFGGGTVDVVLSTEDFHVKRENLHERFEDGTIPFLSVLTLKHCFDVLYSFMPKTMNIDVMDFISYHTFYLAKDLQEQLLNLEHKNGVKAIVLYMDSDFNDIQKQGGIVTFNIKRDDNSYIGYAEFQHMAELFNIHIRTGCFCNAGTCQRHFKISNKQIKEIYKAGHKCGDEMDLVDGQPTGAIRVSFGYYNTFEDVDKMVAMITHCFVKTKNHGYKPDRKIVNIERNITLPIKEKLLTSNIMFKTIGIVPKSVKEFDITLSEISIFPIKSCGAFKTKAWKLGKKGFEYDREWMIVRENGVCLTQKQNTQMCMICPVINIKEKCMVLNFKGKAPIKILLDPLANPKYREITICQSKVCTDVVKGYDCGDEVADWISEALGISFLRLIKQSDSHERVRKKQSVEKQTLLSLSNQAQFLLINRATVRWLKDKILDPLFEDDIPSLTDRFRGNLIIDMDNELVESEWKHLIIDGHEFKVEEQCSRCQMVCIDQKTGEKTVEPLRTISKEFGGKLKFGIYLSYIGPVNAHKNGILKTKSQVLVKL